MNLRGLLTKIELKLRPLQLGENLGTLDKADGITADELATEAEHAPPGWTTTEEDEPPLSPDSEAGR